MEKITNKYVYFVSYAWSTSDNRGHGHSEVGSDLKITSMEHIEHIRCGITEEHNNPGMSVVILNYILLREQ